MCEDRERLIGYVYDECDPTERLTIEAHLAECVECRSDVRGLKRTRQDLLAWDVPEPEPIWRPLAPARSPWSAIPAWAMAAAATVVLAVGAAGGAVTQRLLPVRIAASPVPVPVAQAAHAAPVEAQSQLATIATLEARVRELEQSNATMGELVRTLSARQVVAPEAGRTNVSTSVSASELAQQIRAISERQDELSRTMLTMSMETVGIKNRQAGLQQLVSLSLDPNVRGR